MISRRRYLEKELRQVKMNKKWIDKSGLTVNINIGSFLLFFFKFSVRRRKM